MSARHHPGRAPDTTTVPVVPTGIELVIIGGGNMGAALVGGLLAGGRPANSLAVTEVAPARREQLTAMLPDVHVSDDVAACPAAVLAVKPTVVAEAARSAVAAGARRLLSIAAGITTAHIEQAIDGVTDEPVAVVRAMPNTPALVRRGASAIAPGAAAGADDLAWAEAILGAVGLVVRVDEGQLDAVTALSGSGPAYLFLVAESLAAAGVAVGLAPELAETLTTQLLLGSGELLASRGDAARLRAEVTSPGGTTAAGIAVLEQGGLPALVEAAVRAAAARSRELAAG
jgi:pyrroline-5-carboxylate reductase